MSDPSVALQNSVEAALRGSMALKSAMGLATVRLYTMSAPVGALFPHLTIGDDEVLDDSTECLESSEAYTSVHVWTRVDSDVSASRAQAKAIAGVIRPLLKSLSSVAGFTVTEADFESARHIKDPDGLTGHSIVTHRFLLDPV